MSLYVTEVANFPVIDLHTINTLWWLYSGGKFGFSVQRKLWLSVGKDFNTLWPKIGWKKDNHWTQYPKEFTWNLNAAILANPESKPEERALALGWVMHIVGDIHQPLHADCVWSLALRPLNLSILVPPRKLSLKHPVSGCLAL